NFFLPRLTPGDPAQAIFATYGSTLDANALHSLRVAYGLSDEPLSVQYLEYLGNLARGDFGLSLSQFPSPVTELVGQSIGWSVLLGLVAVTLSFGIGCGIGAIAAWRRGGLIDRFVPPVLVFLSSFPYFFLALLLFYLLAFKLEWFPLGR